MRRHVEGDRCDEEIKVLQRGVDGLPEAPTETQRVQVVRCGDRGPNGEATRGVGFTPANAAVASPDGTLATAPTRPAIKSLVSCPPLFSISLIAGAPFSTEAHT